MSSLSLSSSWSYSTTIALEQHVQFRLQDLITSEVKQKWLVWTKMTPPCSPSAWNSAKRWPTRVKSSTSPLPSVPPFPSPWTPGARCTRIPTPRRRAPQRSGGMPSEGKNSWRRSRPILQVGSHLKMMHLCLPLTGPNATNASTKHLLKRGCDSMWGWSIRSKPVQHLRTWEGKETSQDPWPALLSSLAGKRNVKTARVFSPLDTSVERPLWPEPATAPTPTAVAVIMSTPVNAGNIGNPLNFVIVQINLMYNATINPKWPKGQLWPGESSVHQYLYMWQLCISFSHVTLIKYYYYY